MLPSREKRIDDAITRLEIAAEDLVLLTDSSMKELENEAFNALYLAQHLKNINQSTCEQREENKS
ncbi:hypothetical protein SFC65_04275 [Priestia filamentosa]|uniref:hypothetical protein n=1 Tax=Priestia filamentosa TaxID=1402861 RepID=UPI003982828F